MKNKLYVSDITVRSHLASRYDFTVAIVPSAKSDNMPVHIWHDVEQDPERLLFLFATSNKDTPKLLFDKVPPDVFPKSN